jgi:chromate transporter
MLGTAFKLVRGARPSAPMVVIGLTALGLALWRLPLPWIILGLAPLGILAAYVEARR